MKKYKVKFSFDSIRKMKFTMKNQITGKNEKKIHFMQWHKDYLKLFLNNRAKTKTKDTIVFFEN